MCSSCSPLTRNEYECTITYTIENTPYTDTVNLITPQNNTPVYVCGDNKLIICAIPGSEYFSKLVYIGSHKVSVQSFDYKLIRKLKISNLTGKELK